MTNIKLMEWQEFCASMVPTMQSRHPRVKVELNQHGIHFSTNACAGGASLWLEDDHFAITYTIGHGSALSGDVQSVRVGLIRYADVMAALDDFSAFATFTVWPDGRCPCGYCSGRGEQRGSPCHYCGGTGFKP